MIGIEDSKRYQFLKTITNKKKKKSFFHRLPEFFFSNTKNHKEDFEVQKKEIFIFSNQNSFSLQFLKTFIRF